MWRQKVGKERKKGKKERKEGMKMARLLNLLPWNVD